MADQQADTVIICSSELIANVMQEYFNKKMFKIAVEIVDLQTTESGYAFSLLFKKKEIIQEQTATVDQDWPRITKADDKARLLEIRRDSKGRFEKRETVNEC